MLIDGITRKELRLLALKALLNQTLAEDRVFEPRDWPTDPELFPILMVASPRERKTALHAGQLAFTTTVSIVVVGRVSAATSDDAEDDLDRLAGQVVETLLLDADFQEPIQQFVSIDNQSAVTAQGAGHVGEFGMTFEVTFYQAYGPDGPDLTEITGTTPVGTGPAILTDIKRKDTP